MRAEVRLAALSALILFLEMLLVRWVGTELRIFAYLQNGGLRDNEAHGWVRG